MKNNTVITKENYIDYVEKQSPKSSHFKNIIFAFLIGGLICVIGQLLIELFVYWGFDSKDASVYSSCSLIFLSALATGLGIYDKLGRFAGAGSTIPITGFSNAVVAPSIEFYSEGLIYGLGAKMFTVAGPVIANGVFASAIVVFIRYFLIGV